MINSHLCGWGLSRPQIKKKIDQDSILQKNLKFLMPNRISKVRTTIQMISTLGNPKTSKKVQGIKKSAQVQKQTKTGTVMQNGKLHQTEINVVILLGSQIRAIPILT